MVSSGYPCYVTWNILTGFKQVERRSKYGPAFKGKLPRFMDVNLASFCGYLLGDGWVRKRGGEVGFVVAETDGDCSHD